jgi:short-subunit dehydrogenase
MERELAFISGATSGIGAAFARHFASEGYDLIITGHPNDPVELPLKELKEKYHIDIEFIKADLAIEEKIVEIENIIKCNQRITVLINNAGFLDGTPFLKNNIPALESMIKVHINCPMRFIHAVLPNMIYNGNGIVINLSSLAAFTPFPDYAMYPATKLFGIAFTESLHISLRKNGIKFQVLCPGFVKSNFHQRAGIKLSEFKNTRFINWMTPEEIVKNSIKNLRKKNKVIIIPGVGNRFVRFISLIVPRGLYYKFASVFLT